jgi:hypothetical protein
MDPIIDHFDGFKLNDSITINRDERDPEAANTSHRYKFLMPHGVPGFLDFQHGARDEPGSKPGVTDAAVIAAVIDRYRGFQSGPFACRENAFVLAKLEEALQWIHRRARLRRAKGILGQNVAHSEPE